MYPTQFDASQPVPGIPMVPVLESTPHYNTIIQMGREIAGRTLSKYVASVDYTRHHVYHESTCFCFLDCGSSASRRDSNNALVALAIVVGLVFTYLLGKKCKERAILTNNIDELKYQREEELPQDFFDHKVPEKHPVAIIANNALEIERHNLSLVNRKITFLAIGLGICAAAVVGGLIGPTVILTAAVALGVFTLFAGVIAWFDYNEAQNKHLAQDMLEQINKLATSLPQTAPQVPVMDQTCCQQCCAPA